MIEPRELLERYRAGTCTEAERQYVEAWLLRYRASDDAGLDESDYRRIREANWRAVLDSRFDASAKPVRRLRRWLPYAAAAVLALAVGAWLVIGYQPSAVDTDIAEILPGGNRATLTLADGRTITLDEAQTGIIIGAEDITYQDGSSLAAVIPGVVGANQHSPDVSESAQSVNILSLTTPKGGTYQVTLPDGSKVWLNAASTLKYPSRFSADAREVFLEGEAFFAVSNQRSAISHQPLAAGKGPKADIRKPTAGRLPFRVVTKGQTVEVLGTQFNLSAYADDLETKTTLVEGKVKVTPGTRNGNTQADLTTNDLRLTTKILSPGEQSTTRGSAITVHDVDTEPFTAWRDGTFRFDDTPLVDIMRQVSRWYDVEVDYDRLPDKRISGIVSRNERLSAVLRALEISSQLKFELQERRLVLQKE